MEISLIYVEYHEPWSKILRSKISEMRGTGNGNTKNTIQIVLARNERGKAFEIENAWRKICFLELHKSAHVKKITHELGTTLKLWYSERQNG